MIFFFVCLFFFTDLLPLGKDFLEAFRSKDGEQYSPLKVSAVLCARGRGSGGLSVKALLISARQCFSCLWAVLLGSNWKISSFDISSFKLYTGFKLLHSVFNISHCSPASFVARRGQAWKHAVLVSRIIVGLNLFMGSVDKEKIYSNTRLNIFHHSEQKKLCRVCRIDDIMPNSWGEFC